MKKVKQDFGAAVIGTYMRLKGRLPLRYHYFWGGVAAWVMRDVVRYRYAEAVINLARSFPEKKYGELKRIVKQFYGHVGEVIAEAVWYAGCRGERGIRRFRKQNLVRLTNPEQLNEFYDKGRTVVALTSHMGNWELLGSFYDMAPEGSLKMKHSEIVVIYKKLRSQTWNQVFAVNRTGTVAHTDFDGYVEAMEVMRFAVAHKGDTMVYVFNNDQSPVAAARSYDAGLFLHQPTRGMAGGIALAHKFGWAVVYMRWMNAGRGHYDVTYVPIAEDASRSSVEEILKRYYRMLEEDIEAQPHQYLWTHKRWK